MFDEKEFWVLNDLIGGVGFWGFGVGVRLVIGERVSFVDCIVLFELVVVVGIWGEDLVGERLLGDEWRLFVFLIVCFVVVSEGVVSRCVDLMLLGCLLFWCCCEGVLMLNDDEWCVLIFCCLCWLLCIVFFFCGEFGFGWFRVLGGLVGSVFKGDDFDVDVRLLFVGLFFLVLFIWGIVFFLGFSWCLLVMVLGLEIFVGSFMMIEVCCLLVDEEGWLLELCSLSLIIGCLWVIDFCFSCKYWG